MSFSNKRVGAMVTWSIGPRGGTADQYPARIAAPPQWVTMNGRPTEIVEIIALRTNINGEQYLQRRTVFGLFLQDRTNVVAHIDGTPSAPKRMVDLIAEQEAGLAAFLATRASATSVDSLLADLVGDEAAA